MSEFIPRRVSRPTRGRKWLSQTDRARAIANVSPSTPTSIQEAPRPPAAEVDADTLIPTRLLDQLFHTLSPLYGRIQGGHITRLVEVVKGCKTSTQLSVALSKMQGLGWFTMSKDGFTLSLSTHVRAEIEQQPFLYGELNAVYMENLPHSSPFDVACYLSQFLEGSVYAVYPPTPNGAPPRTAEAIRHGQAFIVLSSLECVKALEEKFDWDKDEVAPRCLSIKEWERRKKCYFQWRDELREVDRSVKEEGETPYPKGTILRLEVSHLPDEGTMEKAKSAIKAALERLVPSSVAYVDVSEDQTHCLIRVPTPSIATSLTRALTSSPPSFITGLTTLRGPAQASYWFSLPIKVRNAALKRASS